MDGLTFIFLETKETTCIKPRSLAHSKGSGKLRWQTRFLEGATTLVASMVGPLGFNRRDHCGQSGLDTSDGLLGQHALLALASWLRSVRQGVAGCFWAVHSPGRGRGVLSSPSSMPRTYTKLCWGSPLSQAIMGM